MLSCKYLVVVALLLFCLFCQQAVEARFLHKLEHDAGKAVHKVDKVLEHVEHVRDGIALAGAVAGVVGAVAA